MNGSFVTGKLSPEDVDVIMLPCTAGATQHVPNDLVFPFMQIITAADDQDLEAWALGDFRHRSSRSEKGSDRDNPMTTLLDQAGYEQTKSKLQSLESRLAAMQDRSDLQAGHKQRVLASYQAMRKQYLEELRLFEAVQARGR